MTLDENLKPQCRDRSHFDENNHFQYFFFFFVNSITRLEVYFYLARQSPDILLFLFITVYSGILPMNASLPVNANLIFLQ